MKCSPCYRATASFASLACLVAVVMPRPALLRGGDAPSVPGTQALTWEGDLADRMMDGLHRFSERQIARSVEQRGKHWQRDTSSAAAYDASVRPNRERFRHIIGLADARVPVRMERWGDDERPALIAETARYQVYQVRWPVLDGVWGEGLLLQPRGKAVAHVVALPDADRTPEQLEQLLVEQGFTVIRRTDAVGAEVGLIYAARTASNA